MARAAPHARIRSILTGEDTVGTKTLAGTPRRIAAYATAAPWLPPEAATTPASGISRSSKLVNAPRALNDPACWSCSSLSVRGNDERAKSLPSTTRTGVTRMWGLMISYTLSISGRSMRASGPSLLDIRGAFIERASFHPAWGVPQAAATDGCSVACVSPAWLQGVFLSAPVHIGAQVFQARVNHQRDHLRPRPQPLCHANRGDDVGSGRRPRKEGFFPGEAPRHVLGVRGADRQDLVHESRFPDCRSP